jgi:hypothetical protein
LHHEASHHARRFGEQEKEGILASGGKDPRGSPSASINFAICFPLFVSRDASFLQLNKTRGLSSCQVPNDALLPLPGFIWHRVLSLSASPTNAIFYKRPNRESPATMKENTAGLPEEIHHPTFSIRHSSQEKLQFPLPDSSDLTAKKASHRYNSLRAC